MIVGQNIKKQIKRNKGSDHHGNCNASVTYVRSLFSLAIPARHNNVWHGQRVSQSSCDSPQRKNVTCFYLLGLSLRLVLLARKELCSWLSSNGSSALERKPCWKGKTRQRFGPRVQHQGHSEEFTQMWQREKQPREIVVRLNYQEGSNKQAPLWCIEQSPCGREVCSVWTTWQ